MSRKLMFAIFLASVLLASTGTHGQTIAAPLEAVPFIDQPLSPAAALPGGNGFVLTVRGGGFDNRSVVYWDGAAVPTTYAGPAELRASISAAEIQSAGTARVTVVNPQPGGGTSAPAYFLITTANSNLNFTSSEAQAGSFPDRLFLADLRGNGKLDFIAYTTFNDFGYNPTIDVLLGNGDGTFQPPVSYVVTHNGGVTTIVAGDFNGDGKLDLAVQTFSFSSTTSQLEPNPLEVLLGNGDGTFQTPITAFSQPGGSSLLAVDLNRDGKLDLVSAGTKGFQVLLGNGDGTFTSGFSYVTPAVDRLDLIALADFHGNGNADLAMIQSDSKGTFAVEDLLTFRGRGDGTFEAPVTLSSRSAVRADAFGTDLVVADFNGDGKQDIAFGSGVCGARCLGPRGMEVFLGHGDGSFGKPVETANLIYVIPGDFNGDGKLDFFSADSLTFFFGNGDGTFTQDPTIFQVGGVAGDFNGDGRIDLAFPFGSHHVIIVDLRTQ
jgi:hypothetical protein